jgi:hypothetical protein
MMTAASTSAVITVNYHAQPTFKATVEFISREELLKYVQALVGDVQDSEADDNDRKIAWEKVSAM